ncbi:hypothetical protein DM02DRAFT_699546 [Periconia macrospinosa]|uniref:Dynamin-type G domain-containing protein n=1 Tax=Periconia macrospinosa TaxID=97972 RepID=A0A2V1D384_9PLEO|nr:hypothetical protein DM02DRAFT_699546 [Periconia macrospinosa]
MRKSIWSSEWCVASFRTTGQSFSVIPANVDIATQEILNTAKDVDPQGQRTLGVLTKTDLVDSGAEKDVLDLMHGKKHKLRLGYCMARN